MVYDIGWGQKLLLHCTGSGLPTVVLEAPIGQASYVWSRVQPILARQTRVKTFIHTYKHMHSARIRSAFCGNTFLAIGQLSILPSLLPSLLSFTPPSLSLSIPPLHSYSQQHAEQHYIIHTMAPLLATTYISSTVDFVIYFRRFVHTIVLVLASVTEPIRSV